MIFEDVISANQCIADISGLQGTESQPRHELFSHRWPPVVAEDCIVVADQAVDSQVDTSKHHFPKSLAGKTRDAIQGIIQVTLRLLPRA